MLLIYYAETLGKVRDIGLNTAPTVRKVQTWETAFCFLAKDFRGRTDHIPLFPHCKGRPRFRAGFAGFGP
jgi:hypothetical protein